MTVDITEVLTVLPVRPRMLALGEPTHGEDALLDVRNAMFRHLVEREGYRTIAVESDCLRGLLVDAYVTTGDGDLDHVMAHGFSHGFGASPANRDLVRWMREHNHGRPAADRVRFAGFDAPVETAAAASPRPSLTALYDRVAAGADAALLPCTAETLDDLLGPDERWTEPAAMREPARSAGRTPSAQRLRLIADDLVALLGPDATALDRLHARTATGLLRYHSWMADTAPHRLAGVLTARATMMAANLLALAERGPVLVHAGNAHLQRPRSSMRLGGDPVHWWSAGGRVAARLGADYAFVATAVGTIHHRGVGVPPAGTVEGMLYAGPATASSPSRAPSRPARRACGSPRGSGTRRWTRPT